MAGVAGDVDDLPGLKAGQQRDEFGAAETGRVEEEAVKGGLFGSGHQARQPRRCAHR